MTPSLKSKRNAKKKKSKKVAYVPFDANDYDKRASDAHMLQMFFPVVFNDVWMKLIDGFNLNNTKCKIQDVVYKEVDESCIDSNHRCIFKRLPRKNRCHKN